MITPAHAAMAAVLCNVLYIVQGDIGRGAATLGVMAVGASAVLGKVSMNLAVTVAVGVGILFGATNIASYLGFANPC